MLTNKKLGIKVFYYYLSKRVVSGIFLLVVSFIISSLKGVMVAKMALAIPLTTSLSIANFLVNGLFIISILLIIFGILMSWINYISCEYALDENAISIRRGIFNKKEVFIPYRQIENINIDQTFNFKMMGVSKLIIETAGNDGNNGGDPEGVFDVIDSNVATSIREFILQRTNTEVIK
ncbi:MAG: PH domain-containing protein [Candidatus Nomurabacteria bacterium]